MNNSAIKTLAGTIWVYVGQDCRKLNTLSVEDWAKLLQQVAAMEREAKK